MAKARRKWGPEDSIVVVQPHDYPEGKTVRIKVNGDMAKAARWAISQNNWDDDSRGAASSIATKAETSETNPLPRKHITPWNMHIKEITLLEDMKKPTPEPEPPSSEPEPPLTLF